MAKKNKNIKYKKMLPATPANVTEDNGFKPYDFEPLKTSIQNFEFFSIFNECKKRNKGLFADQSSASSSSFSYDLYKMEKNYPSPKRKRRSTEELYKSTEKLSRQLWIDIAICAIPMAVCIFLFAGLIINFVIEIFKPADETVDLFTKIFKFVLREIVLIGIIILITKINSWRKNTKRLESHPYYELCKNLTMTDASKVTLTYPTKRIEESYRKYKSIISEEWRITSHDFITNRWFRMRPYEFDFPNYGRYIFYVEVKYKSCFPDYPALISIEDEIGYLSFMAKDDHRAKLPLSDYKNMIRNRVKELISERIPDMEVEEVCVEAGCTGHMNTKRGPKFRTEGEKPAYMENDMDREGKIILKSDMIKNIEKYRKV